MALKLYGLTKCSTCQKAIDWLDEHKIAHSFSDVKDNPITKEQVAKWSKALGRLGKDDQSRGLHLARACRPRRPPI